ncbi:MAG: DHHA1 domain-containing protein [Anaerolineae bacterium]
MPPTVRLFWRDAYQTEFQAHVIRRLAYEGRPAVVLDETCFYPTSGGQPHDTGHLNRVPVLDVLEVEDEIVHVLDAPLEADAVEGFIDWERRQDHMQQHAGQHVLSAAFERILNAGTISFHLGSDECTIDVACRSVESEQLDQVEDYANRIVMDNLPIRTLQYSPQELRDVPLRKPPKIEGLVRVVSVGDVDYSACGGTHPSSSGEIGQIHIDRWERRRGAARITFLCGLRALRDYRLKSRISRQLATQASVSVEELPGAIERLSSMLDESRRQATALRAQWLDLEARELDADAQSVGPYRVIAHIMSRVEPSEMRVLAQGLCQSSGTVAVLAIEGPAPQFCLARAQDVPVNMNDLLRASAAPYGGRGGGQPNMVQGGGIAAQDLDRMMADARRYLSDLHRTAMEGDLG